MSVCKYVCMILMPNVLIHLPTMTNNNKRKYHDVMDIRKLTQLQKNLLLISCEIVMNFLFCIFNVHSYFIIKPNPMTIKIKYVVFIYTISFVILTFS